MSKKIIYTDEYGNKVDVNSIQGLCMIFDSIFNNYDDTKDCFNIRENIKAVVSECYINRVNEITKHI